MFGANDPQSGGIAYYSRYTYVDNATIGDPRLGIPECTEAVGATNDLVFDPVFMKCVYTIGFRNGATQSWKDFYKLPTEKKAR